MRVRWTCPQRSIMSQRVRKYGVGDFKALYTLSSTKKPPEKGISIYLPL